MTDESGSAGARAGALSQYWLADTPLFDHGDAAVFTVTAPTRVELLPDGRVRSTPDAVTAFEGAVPSEILHEPQPHRGFMLYAQREGELRFRHPDGPYLGRLHPGAFVSVVPAEGGPVRIGSLPFERGRERVVAYVDRAVLGIEPRKPEQYRPPPPFWSLRAPSVPVWSDEPVAAPQEAWWTVPCRDLWIWPESHRVSQYADGVELSGMDDAFSRRGYNPVAFFEAVACPAPAVARHGSHLSWIDPARGDTPLQTDEVPEGYRRYEPLDSDPLPGVLERGSDLYWLLPTEQGLVCDGWRFRAFAGKSGSLAGEERKGYLVRKQPVVEYDGRQTVRFPVTYLPSHGRTPSVVRLETLELGGRPALKCECIYHYALLQADGVELGVMGRPLPDDLVAYDPAALERWFLSRAGCEIARDQTEEALAAGKVSATRLGIHASIAAFGL